MDCNHARLLLIFARKRSELEATEAEALDGHLQHCAQCAGLADAEQHLDEALGRAVRDVPVPAGLPERLSAGLARDLSLRRWRRGLAAASIAAALLLAFGAAWFFWLGARSTPDYDSLYTAVTDKVRATPETVENWFHERGVTMEAPRQLNYDLLISYDTTEFMNRRVPRLVFFYRGDNRNPPAIAEVYVLSTHQFHLDPGSQHPASMELLTGNPNFQYVAIVNTGGSLLPFKVEQVQN